MKSIFVLTMPISRALQRRDSRAPHRCLMLLAALVLLAGCVSRGTAQNVQEVYRLSPGQFANHMEYHNIDLDPGKEIELANLDGPGKVTYFYFTDNSGSARQTEKARESGDFYPGLTLKVYWDDQKEPSVWLPLWDFFGALDRTPIEYQSAMLQINHRAFMSHLPMPFSRRARFVLANDGNEPDVPLVRDQSRPVSEVTESRDPEPANGGSSADPK